MIKKYKGKIKQYSIEGELLNEYENAKDAEHICNYDSIIRCCTGKYKTASGYVWRFEDEPFEKDEHVKGDIKCKICNSFETSRSMAMHLRWVHKTNTEDYIKKYGEFRKKNIKENKLRESSNISCKICNEKLKSNQHLMYHITKEHKDITQSDYIIKYFYEGNIPLCKCGCNQPVEILRNGNNCDLKKETYSRDYIKGHWDWDVFTNIGKQSKEEIELENFIRSIYNGNVEINKRGIIKNRELDLYLPDLNIAIEYNGLYWHSEKTGRMKEYHINKTNECNKLGIRLIQIFSDEWLNKRKIVENKLISILGCNHNKTYGRKCIIKEIDDPKIKNNFLTKHHIQGADRSKVKIGLYENNILIGIMTFSSPRMVLGGKNFEGFWELSRYATSKQIIGGASKIISYFVKKYNPKKIYSYSDNRWTDVKKNMYISSGFKFVSSSSPGYFYTKDYLTRHHRFLFSKQNLQKKGININNKTEREVMEELGYTRVWDCGVTKYEINF